MRHNNVLVIGGAGFIGRHIVARLIDRGLRVTVPTRRRARARHLIMLPTIDVVECDVHDAATLDTLIRDQDAVINLVGILHGSQATPYGREFAQAHVELPRRIVAACRRLGVGRDFAHECAGRRLEWSVDVSTQQGRRRRGGERIQSELDHRASLRRIRPGRQFPESVCKTGAIFSGAADRQCDQRAFNPYGSAMWPMPLSTRWTVARPFSIPTSSRGPHIYQLRDLVAFAAAASGHPRPIIALPPSLARLQATLMELMPGAPLMSRDNLDSMKVDNVASQQPFMPAPELGIRLTPIEAEAPAYLSRAHTRNRFSIYRARAGR